MTGYYFSEKSLVIKDESTGEVIWQGMPFGCSVERIMTLPGQRGCIVLLNGYEFSQSEWRHLSNLIHYNADGKIKWTAQLPETIDSFVAFDWEENRLYANSWSCFRVHIDLETGKILNRIFTK